MPTLISGPDAFVRDDVEIITRCDLVELIEAFARQYGRKPRYVALTAAQYAQTTKFHTNDGDIPRPETLFGMTLLGTDSPVFFLA